MPNSNQLENTNTNKQQVCHGMMLGHDAEQMLGHDAEQNLQYYSTASILF